MSNKFLLVAALLCATLALAAAKFMSNPEQTGGTDESERSERRPVFEISKYFKPEYRQNLQEMPRRNFGRDLFQNQGENQLASSTGRPTMGQFDEDKTRSRADFDFNGQF